MSLRGGACSAIALCAFFAFSLTAPAIAADFTVPPASGAQTVGNNDHGTILSGGTLSAATGITWNAGSATPPGVIIDNSGTISATTRGIDTSGSFTTGTFTLNNNTGAIISATGNDAFRINTNISNGAITINNSGTIRSTGGQAIDFGAITANGATISINNLAGGVIQSAGEDTVRPGQNATITNWGTITSGAGGDGVDVQNTTGTVINKAGGVISAGKHGINVGTGGNVYVTNEAGGTIIGRNGSGVGSDNIANIGTILNYGTITGAYDQSATGDGDGVDIDGPAAITNYGTIQGTGAAGFDSGGRANNSEGLSIGGGTVENHGLISGFSRGIVVNNDSNPHQTRSGVAATTLSNYAGASIIGENGFAIRFENKTGTAADNDTITNYGTIIGNGAIPDPSAVVLLVDGVTPDPAHGTLDGVAYGAGSARFIRGDGSAIQTGEGNDVLANYGTITGNNGRALNMEGGADSLTNWGTINGSIDLGGGANTLTNYEGGLLNVGTVLSVGAGRTVDSSGTISPGGDGSILTTILTGKLVQTSTGTLAIDLNAAANTADRIDVTETATLDGSVKLSVAGIAISSGTVTVLTDTGSASHDLSLIASPALQASLVYPDANTVQISYALSFAPTGIGLNQNQTSLGSHLNAAVIADPTKLTAITTALLSLTSGGEYVSALDQLSPEVYGDAAASGLYAAHTFGNSLLSCRSRDAAYVGVSENECVWAAISGRDYDQNATASGIGYDEQTWGVSGGAQVTVAHNLVVGLAGGIEQGSADTTSGASADIDRVYAGAALKHASGPWLFAAAVFGGKGTADTTRPINFGGLTTLATGEQDVKHLSGRLRAAYQAGSNALYLKPMVDLEATQLWLGSVQEEGGAGALSIDSSEETIFSAAPALELGGEVALEHGMLLRPFIRVGGIFYSEDKIALSSSFAGAPAGVPKFQTQAEVEQVMGNVGAGLDLMWTDASTVKVFYDGLFGEDTQQHAFGAKASVNF